MTVPPGRIATVQSNFVMRRCNGLASGQTIVVPGTVVLTYRVAGHVHRREIPLPVERILLRRGPTKRQCNPVAGSLSLVAADTGCNAARRAALACHPMSHGSWGSCSVAGQTWDCGRTGGDWPYLETCWPPTRKSQWFRARWDPPVLSNRAIGGVRLGLPRREAVAELSALLGQRSRGPFENSGCGAAYTEVAWQHLYAEFRRGRLSGFRYIEGGWPIGRSGEGRGASDLPLLVTSRKITLGDTLGQARGAYGRLRAVGTDRWQTSAGLVLYDNARHSPDLPSSRIVEIKLRTCGDF